MLWNHISKNTNKTCSTKIYLQGLVYISETKVHQDHLSRGKIVNYVKKMPTIACMQVGVPVRVAILLFFVFFKRVISIHVIFSWAQIGRSAVFGREIGVPDREIFSRQKKIKFNVKNCLFASAFY